MTNFPAGEQLERILYILPAAHRPGGVALDELARALDVDAETIIGDLEAVVTREYYHPGGSTDSMCLALEGDRVTLTGFDDFLRPVRLNEREALAVQLGLRALAAECDVARRVRVLALAARIEAELVTPEVETVHEMRVSSAEGMAPSRGFREPEPELEYDLDEEREVLLGVGDDVLRGQLSDAIVDGRAVLLQYLKSGAHAPESRRVAPQQLVYFEGTWYLLAFDLERAAPRIFRLDRMLDAVVEEAVHDPAAADRAWIDRIAEQERAPYHAEADVQVVVRYSPVIARWIAERANVAPEPDGSVRVHHRVADSRWIIRHVLQYGGAAWVEAPEELRREVARAALELSA